MKMMWWWRDGRREPEARSRENPKNPKLHMGGSHKFQVQLSTPIRRFPESFRRWGAKKQKVNSIWETQISLRSYPLIQSLSRSWLGVLRNLKRVGTFANALVAKLLKS